MNLTLHNYKKFFDILSRNGELIINLINDKKIHLDDLSSDSTVKSDIEQLLSSNTLFKEDGRVFLRNSLKIFIKESFDIPSDIRDHDIEKLTEIISELIEKYKVNQRERNRNLNQIISEIYSLKDVYQHGVRNLRRDIEVEFKNLSTYEEKKLFLETTKEKIRRLDKVKHSVVTFFRKKSFIEFKKIANNTDLDLAVRECVNKMNTYHSILINTLDLIGLYLITIHEHLLQSKKIRDLKRLIDEGRIEIDTNIDSIVTDERKSRFFRQSSQKLYHLSSSTIERISEDFISEIIMKNKLKAQTKEDPMPVMFLPEERSIVINSIFMESKNIERWLQTNLTLKEFILSETYYPSTLSDNDRVDRFVILASLVDKKGVAFEVTEESFMLGDIMLHDIRLIK